MKNNFTYGDRKIEYVVAPNPELASKVRIHVHPSGLVEVETPTGRTGPEIFTAVRKRARWITKQLSSASLAREHALPREYTSGETHFYLGRRYQLKVTESSSEPSGVTMKGGYLRVVVRQSDRAAIRRRLNSWYLDRAEDYLRRRVFEVSETISWLKSAPPMKLIPMNKQWGSCSPGGTINLNPWLIRAPRECVDYVITHEICHLREHNHSKRFYNLLLRHSPEWRRVKTRLDGMAELLLAD